MDHFAFRAANLLVGNDASAAGLEVTLRQLRAPPPWRRDGRGLRRRGARHRRRERSFPLWESRRLEGGSELHIGISPGPGFRLYVAFSGGIDVPPLFGSRGDVHDGRARRA
jgi:urea carboxylase